MQPLAKWKHKLDAKNAQKKYYPLNQRICLGLFLSYSNPCNEFIEIGLLNLWLSVSQDAPLGDFLLIPMCPVEKVTLWEDLLHSETNEGVM